MLTLACQQVNTSRHCNVTQAKCSKQNKWNCRWCVHGRSEFGRTQTSLGRSLRAFHILKTRHRMGIRPHRSIWTWWRHLARAYGREELGYNNEIRHCKRADFQFFYITLNIEESSLYTSWQQMSKCFKYVVLCLLVAAAAGVSGFISLHLVGLLRPARFTSDPRILKQIAAPCWWLANLIANAPVQPKFAWRDKTSKIDDGSHDFWKTMWNEECSFAQGINYLKFLCSFF